MKLQQPPSRVAGQVLSPPVVRLEDGDMGTARVSLGRCSIVLVFVDKGVFVSAMRCARRQGWCTPWQEAKAGVRHEHHERKDRGRTDRQSY